MYCDGVFAIFSDVPAPFHGGSIQGLMQFYLNHKPYARRETGVSHIPGIGEEVRLPDGVVYTVERALLIYKADGSISRLVVGIKPRDIAKVNSRP